MISELFELPSLPQILSQHDHPEAEDELNLNLDILNIDSAYVSTPEFQKKRYSEPTFSFFNYNIRSLSSNFDNFTDIVENCGTKLDVILLTETWISSDSIDFFKIPSYSGFHSYRSHKKGGGLSIFINKDHLAHQIPEFSFVNNTLEMNTVKISSGTAELYLIGIYRPPSGSLDEFFESLEPIIHKFKGKKLIISGDLNLDLLQLQNDQRVLSFFNLLLSSALYPTITRATRLNKNNPKASTLLDHTWTNFNNLLESHVLLTDISDHFPCVSVFKYSTPIQKISFITQQFRQNKNESNITRFLKNLININFDFVFDQNLCLEAKFELFDKVFWNCYEENFPLKTRKISTKKVMNPWLSKEIKDEISRKHELYKLKLKGSIPAELYNNFKTYVEKLVFEAKKDYFSNKLKQTNGDMKKQWNFINQVMRKEFEREQPTCIENSNQSKFILQTTKKIQKLSLKQ